jgi:hypothetical protein
MKRFNCALGLTILFVVSACASNETEPEDADDQIVSTTAAYTYSNTYYDWAGGTFNQCSVGGITMHCCADGFVMIGAHLAQNVFKCTRINSSMQGARYLSANNSCTVPPGYHTDLMVGFHEAFGRALCQQPVNQPTTPLWDQPPNATQDGWPMHVCPGPSVFNPFKGSALVHINPSTNAFLCGR